MLIQFGYADDPHVARDDPQLDIGVPKSNESGSEKSLVLTDAAHGRLWAAIKQEYGETPNISKLSKDVGLDPKVVRKIRDRTDPSGVPLPVSCRLG